MFIGPLTVYLGALLGARRVLLVCSGVFAIVSACLPFAHSYSLLIVLLAIAGLSSGTFYPLTISFALLNVPLRYLALTLGVYATCYRGRPELCAIALRLLSGSPVVGVDVLDVGDRRAGHDGVRLLRHSGVPAARSRRDRSRASPDSCTSAPASRCCSPHSTRDSGSTGGGRACSPHSSRQERFLLLCAIVRRLRAPNPLVDLPYLRKWNTIALALGLFSFRFVLLATALVIPQSLSFRGLDAAQFGPAVLWTAVPEMFLAVFAAHLLNKGLDSRLLMALGFATIGAACLVNAEFTSAWAAENYFRTELLMAVGQSFAFVGLVSTLILQAFFSGGLDSPFRVLTFSAFLHVVRIFGGQVGTTVMARFIAEQEKLHSYLAGASRPAGRLDHRAHGEAPDRRAGRPIERGRGRRRPRGRTRCRQRSSCRPTRSPSSTRFISSPGCRSRR